MHRDHVEGLEAEQASQVLCPVQHTTRDNELEDENVGVPGTVDAADENAGTHEVRHVVTKVEGECQ